MSARLLGSLARLLILSTQADVQNPELALEYAQRAVKVSSAPQHIETLALCHAAAGRFEEAIKTQQRLLDKIGATAPPKAQTRMKRNLERYRTKQLGRLPFDTT